MDGPSLPPGATLLVEFEGCLLRSNLAAESILALIRHNPFYIFALLAWALRGPVYLRQQVLRRTGIESSTLAYDPCVIAFLQREKQQGRRILLLAEGHPTAAALAAGIIGGFDGVVTIAELNKAQESRPDFVYVGNRTDVSEHLPLAGLLRSGPPSGAGGEKLGNCICPPPNRWRAALRLIRPHQWLKNLLVFAPATAGHMIFDWDVVSGLTRAMICLSLVASSLYILNDVADIESDRRHPQKRNRPLATGELSVAAALCLAAVLFVSGLVTALLLPSGAMILVIVYATSALLYTWVLKKYAIVDIAVLVGLYLLRLLIGHEAVGVQYSYWFMMFFAFMLTSLALLKRFCELQTSAQTGDETVPGRDYRQSERSIIAMIGVSAGMAAILIAALYVHSADIEVVYNHPGYLSAWVAIILISFVRLWLSSARGELIHDPVLHLMKDPFTYIAGVLGLAVAYLAL